MKSSNSFQVILTGTDDDPIPVSSNYYKTQLVVIGLATGTLTVRAMSAGGDAHETVEGASLDLSEKRTLTITGFLDEVEITAPDACTVKILQFETPIRPL